MDWSRYAAVKAAAATMPALVPLVWSYEREAVSALLGAFCRPLPVIVAPESAPLTARVAGALSAHGAHNRRARSQGSPRCADILEHEANGSPLW